MCVLQDFEALTPNLLARTIETVEGGGIIVLLLKTMSSLKQLYTMTMDVHSRLRTESKWEVTGRFNERFLLSLGSSNKNALVVDDELNILPISSHSRFIKPLDNLSLSNATTPEDEDLKELKLSLKDTEFVGSLVNKAKTLDQAKAVLTCIEAISEKTLRTTVAITAARGRGKSAALGLSIAAAVASGYSNIFVTSPSPENLKTLFEFVFIGFDCLEYQEHIDYEIVQSTNPEFNKAVVRVNIFRSHRQTIQFIHPQDHSKLGQAELVVIDEAAAIPLPYVKQLVGPYLLFMASTVNGYEGTGRSLSLKLIKQMRDQSRSSGSTSGRALRELTMQVPIRYANGDPIEKWLNELLCLDASVVPKAPTGCPHPSECQLYYVNRDTLFSYHKASESFLQRMMALYVSSHYKNSPNDLLLMSDAPAHHLFVLLGPVDETQNTLPEVLTVIQVCLEGELTKQVVMESLARGEKAAGDLIPWTLSQQFQDEGFPSLSGARVVRIATHPDYQRMGYGIRALELLKKYYQGEITSLKEYDEEEEEEESRVVDMNGKDKDEDEHDTSSSIMTEQIKPRKNLPPLLQKLEERRAERLDWLGTSYGLTESLFNFWTKCQYLPVYLRQTPNELTGEHSCIMLTALKEDYSSTKTPDWLIAFNEDFKRRFLSLLAFDFRKFPAGLCLNVLNFKPDGMTVQPPSFHPDQQDEEDEEEEQIEPKAVRQLRQYKQELDWSFTPFDLKRLESYAHNLLDYHAILDLLPQLSRWLFFGKLRLELDVRGSNNENSITLMKKNVSLSFVQATILLALGLQHKSIDDVLQDLPLQSNQVLAMFSKALKKASQFFKEVQEKFIALELHEQEHEREQQRIARSGEKLKKLKPIAQSLESELKESALQASSSTPSFTKEDRQKEIMASLGPQFMVRGTDEEWENQLQGKSKIPGSISLKRKKQEKGEEKKSTSKSPNNSNKKKKGGANKSNKKPRK
ncbi:N-acetyltransferase 10 [Balamuthia mandrillaris]